MTRNRRARAGANAVAAAIVLPFSLAVIGLAAPVVAGALPLIGGWIRETRREKRAAAEQCRVEQARSVGEKRAQCVKLLKLAHNFRVLVENTYESSGTDLDTNARRVRQFAADITSLADEVEFTIRDAEPAASALAAAAGELAAPVADRENRKLGTSLSPPNFEAFDQCRDEFKRAALAALGDQPAVSAGRAAVDIAEDVDRLVPGPASHGIQEGPGQG